MPSAIRVIDTIEELASAFADGKVPQWSVAQAKFLAADFPTDASTLQTHPASDFLLAANAGQSHWTRTVIVDQGGRGDYTTIKAACDYVAAQAGRAYTALWIVLVFPGQYTEQPFTVPDYCMVAAILQTNSQQSYLDVILIPAVDNGVFITLTGSFSGLTGLYIRANSVSAGGLTLVSAQTVYAGGDSINRCKLHCGFTASVDPSYCLVTDHGGLIVSESTIITAGGAYGVGVYCTSTTSGYLQRCVHHAGATGVGTAVKVAPGGIMTLQSCILSTATGVVHLYDLYNDGGTLNVMETPYRAAYGKITPMALPSLKIGRAAANQMTDLQQWRDQNDRVLAGLNPQGFYGDGNQLRRTPDTMLRQYTARTIISGHAPVNPVAGDVWVQVG